MCRGCRSTSAAPHSLLQTPSYSSEPHRWKEYLKGDATRPSRKKVVEYQSLCFKSSKLPENILKMLSSASPRYQICTWSTSTRGRTRTEISKFQAASIPKCEGHGIGAPRERHGQPARLAQCATASKEFGYSKVCGTLLLEKKTSTFLHFLASRIIAVPITWAAMKLPPLPHQAETAVGSACGFPAGDQINHQLNPRWGYNENI